MTTRLKALGAGLLLLVLCAGAPSDDKQTDKNTESGKNSEVVSRSFTALAAAIKARDARAVSELFTPAGEFIDADDNLFEGREAIAGEFAALFEVNPGGAVELVAEEIREISPGVLAVDSAARFPGVSGADPVEVDFSAMIVRQADGRWLLASVRSEGERTPLTPHGHLKRLEWLVGEWVDESDESTMHTTTRWSDDGQFLLTDFAVHFAGHKLMHGTQRIGWDAFLEKFRSWVFDSEGGFAEGVWTEMHGHWTVRATGVRPDGKTASATHTYQRIGPDSHVFMVTNRILGDEPQPDFISTVVRKPPEPGAAPKPAAAPRAK
jgi:uncharacterized protein (TIGR02246 family)